MFFSYETRPTNSATGRGRYSIPVQVRGRSWNSNRLVSTPWVQARRLRNPLPSSMRSTLWVGTITPDEGRWKCLNSA